MAFFRSAAAALCDRWHIHIARDEIAQLHDSLAYDMAVKYGDVVPVAEVIAHLRAFEGAN